MRQHLRRHSSRMGRAVGHFQDGRRGGVEGLDPTALINDWCTGGEAQHWCIGVSRGAANIGNGGSAVLCRAARARRDWSVLGERLMLGCRSPLA